jgi:hypothetical protein
MQYFVYAIGKSDDLFSPYNNCYIGVTNKLQSRWNNHKKSKYTVGKRIRENSWSFENNMMVIFSGSDIECFNMESNMRPLPGMGLNEAAGGCGGYTSYTLERNIKISEKLKGRSTKEWASKSSETKRKNKSAAGSRNNKAKSWIIEDPDGKIFEVSGTLKQFCIENNLLVTCLRYYLGQVVPSPSIGVPGGFRNKNQSSTALRYNTTGWRLSENYKTY